jgi:hypothetical protein
VGAVTSGRGRGNTCRVGDERAGGRVSARAAPIAASCSLYGAAASVASTAAHANGRRKIDVRFIMIAAQSQSGDPE